MSHFIGSVELPSIEGVTFSSLRSVEEIDVVGEDDNIILLSAGEAERVTIDFALYEGFGTSETILFEDKRDYLKELASNAAIENDFVYKEHKGYISVTDVSIPHSGDSNTLIRGSLEGIFLPWPRYFPDNEPIPGYQFGVSFGRLFGGSKEPSESGEFGSNFGENFGGT